MRLVQSVGGSVSRETLAVFSTSAEEVCGLFAVVDVSLPVSSTTYGENS